MFAPFLRRIAGYVTAKKLETGIFEYKKQRNYNFQYNYKMLTKS